MKVQPPLKAAVPQSPMVDGWRGDDWFHNGAFRISAFEYVVGLSTKKGEGDGNYARVHFGGNRPLIRASLTTISGKYAFPSSVKTGLAGTAGDAARRTRARTPAMIPRTATASTIRKAVDLSSATGFKGERVIMNYELIMNDK